MAAPQLSVDDSMSPCPYTIQADESVAQARKLMETYHIRHLPVLEGNLLVGVLSMRDIDLLGCLQKVDADQLKVREAVVKEPYAVQVGTPLREVAAVLHGNKYGSAVVLDGERVVGLFTTVDAMRVLAEVL